MRTQAENEVTTPQNPPVNVEFAGDVLEQIRRHARGSMSAEICGILIGTAADGKTWITARIPGEGAEQGGAHVTFTQNTWEHIYKIKDAQYPEESIVGWYHSHPGFGIFLSDYDLFIHENFFSASHQVAWVFDPHSDEEGCFGWVGKKVEPLPQFSVVRKHRPPAAEQMEREVASRQASGNPAPTGRVSAPGKGRRPSRWKRTAWMVLLVAIGFGGGLAFPRFFPEQAQAIWSFLDRDDGVGQLRGSQTPPPLPPPGQSR